MKQAKLDYYWPILNSLLIICIMLATSSCSMLGESSIDKTNRMIDDSNAGRLEAFASAMEICDEKPGCIVAVSMAFASNMGQQQFIRPESVLDYIRELRQWVDPIGNLIDRLEGNGGTSGDRAANVVKGDGNVILVGNRSSADNGSTSGFSLNQSYSRTWTGYNRSYTNQEPVEGLEGTE
jgi:hypothetical protein